MNLRLLVLACLLIGLSRGANAQAFTILHASPQCKDLTTGKQLTSGQTLTGKEKLNLGDRNGRIVLWSAAGGVELLAAKPLEGNKWKTTGAIAELTHPFPPTPHQGYQEHFGSLADLVTHFSGRKYLILDKTWLLVDPPFRVKGDTVLFFKYEGVQADIEVSRKVEHRGDSLLLDPKFILDMNGRAIPADDARNFKLYWLNKKTLGYSQLARFDFVFVDQDILVKEVGLLLSQLQTTKEFSNRADATVEQFLIVAYGIPDPHNLRVWMQRYFPEPQ